jgi:hypothetical protein
MVIKIFYLVILGLIFNKAACISNLDMNDEVLLTIYHYKIPCMGENIQLCYQAQKNNSEPQLFYDQIEGFDYEWGYNYTVSVEKVPVANPMADASSFKYKLKNIIRKDKILQDETFELPLKMEEQSLIESKNDVCYYFGEVEIQTGRYSCQEVAQAQSAIFSHNSKKAALVLVRLK